MENGTRNGEPAALSVVAQEMTAMDLSSPPHSPPARQPSPPFVQRELKSVNTRVSEKLQQQENGEQDTAIFEQTERETKLELYQIDPLVDVKGLKSMGGQQPGLPQSPRDVDEYSIDVDRPGENPGYISLFFEAQIGKMGTLMGVFVPCLQNILGIIFYIRFTWYLEQPSISMFVLPVHILNWHFPQCYCY